MSVKLKAALAAALALCAVLFCSCGTKEELFESYDSCFVEIPNGYASFTLTPDTQSLMLYGEVYEYSFVSGGVMISFSCPVEDAYYDWYITRLEGSEILSDKQKNGEYRWHTQDIAFFITNSDDCVFYKDVRESMKSCSYRIHLWVRVGEQRFYDSAVLAFHALD
ncbi:MAG: hypothetical protein K2I95_04805 [Treponemataceae bacterium]|nr:hypothetical protein [Treponemataceae bacterium]